MTEQEYMDSLNEKYVYIREDGKEFRVTFLSHWTDIRSLDGEEQDTVKFAFTDYEGEVYVSHSLGYKYTKRVKPLSNQPFT